MSTYIKMLLSFIDEILLSCLKPFKNDCVSTWNKMFYAFTISYRPETPLSCFISSNECKRQILNLENEDCFVDICVKFLSKCELDSKADQVQLGKSLTFDVPLQYNRIWPSFLKITDILFLKLLKSKMQSSS